MKVVVGMSGGVDSSVAALLLTRDLVFQRPVRPDGVCTELVDMFEQRPPECRYS